MAEAFGATFWYALALVVIAFVVAIVLLPKQKPEPLDDPADDAEAAAAAGAGRALAPQVGQHREDAPVVVLAGRQIELGEDRCDVLRDRALR